MSAQNKTGQRKAEVDGMSYSTKAALITSYAHLISSMAENSNVKVKEQRAIIADAALISSRIKDEICEPNTTNEQELEEQNGRRKIGFPGGS